VDNRSIEMTRPGKKEHTAEAVIISRNGLYLRAVGQVDRAMREAFVIAGRDDNGPQPV
jgi:hypothetical protein